MNAGEIKTKLQQCGIEGTVESCEKLCQFTNMLLEWNNKMDLTAITGEEDIFYRHYVDSLMMLSVEDVCPFYGASMIDVGTGAGFPGMIIAIFRPDIKMTLLDSQMKRLNFLKAVRDTLDISNVHLIHARAEDGARLDTLRDSFDYAVARALAPMNVLSEYLLPYVKVSGKAVCWKGPNCDEEMEGCRKACFLLGGKVEKSISYNIASTDFSHRFVVLKKVAATPRAYPRKAGTPGKIPLGV